MQQVLFGESCVYNVKIQLRKLHSKIKFIYFRENRNFGFFSSTFPQLTIGLEHNEGFHWSKCVFVCKTVSDWINLEE